MRRERKSEYNTSRDLPSARDFVGTRIEHFLRQLSLAQRFMLSSFVILVTAMVGLGWWIGQQIGVGVVHRTAATTALYVDSFIAPELQELAEQNLLSPGHVADLDNLLRNTPLGRQIAAFKIWDGHGRILYSTNPASIGQMFPVQGGLARAWQGQVAARVSDLRDEENISERESRTHLLEMYSPVRLHGTNQVIAVAEFYQIVDDLQREIASAQKRSWLVVGIATLVIYLLLASMVRQASDTIQQQQIELSDKVARLTQLLAQNEDLHKRVRRAATRTTALNERFLRRISAELHDGPAQDLGLALLRVDSVIARCGACQESSSDGPQINRDLNTIQTSLEHALREIRTIAAGLRLPELDRLTLEETLTRVVRVHERRTESKVTLTLNDLPAQATLAVKITLFRFVQEALTNAYRHGHGLGQEVRVRREAGHLIIEVSDQGPGFNWDQVTAQDGHLGLVGMRERVESLGGLFRVESGPGRGTTISARLAFTAIGGAYEQ